MYGAVHKATVPVEFKDVQYAGIFDPGTYNVSVKMGDKAKECITGMRIFGAGYDPSKPPKDPLVLHPVTESKIEFQFSSDPECMRDMSVYITIVPVTTDETKLDDKMAFQIGLRPLTVSFDKLVAALTCPQFRLDALQEDVVRTVLAAAVGMDNPCSAIQDATGIQGEGYDWEVSPGAQLTYIAKKGDREAFRIIFQGPDPVVWIRSADEETVKAAVEEALKNNSRPYVLKIGVFDPETGEERYGGETSKTQALAKTLTPGITNTRYLGMIATYAATCTATVATCEAAITAMTGGLSFSLSAKDLLYEIPGCLFGAAITTTAFSTTSATAKVERAGIGILAPFASDVTKYWLLKHKPVSRLYSLALTDELKPVVNRVFSVASQVGAQGGVDYEDAVRDIYRILKNNPSTIPGIDYGNVRVYKLLGWDDTTLEAVEKVMRSSRKSNLAEILEKDIKSISDKDLENLLDYLKNARSKTIKDAIAKGESAMKRSKSYLKDLQEDFGKPSWKTSLLCSAVGSAIATGVTYAYLQSTIAYPELQVELLAISYDNAAKIATYNAGTVRQLGRICVGGCSAQYNYNAAVPEGGWL